MSVTSRRRGSPPRSAAPRSSSAGCPSTKSAVIGERFDIVLFMGVLYHLRHPLLALDLIHATRWQRHAGVPIDAARQPRSTSRLPRTTVRGNRDLRPPGFPKLHFVERRYADDPTNWWIPNRACAEAMLRSAGFAIIAHPEDEVYLCRRSDDRPRGDATREGGGAAMIEAAMIWNEPNNKSHWDSEIDPDWRAFARHGECWRRRASSRGSPDVPRVLGGISPIDPVFMLNMQSTRRARRTWTSSPCTAFRSIGTTGRSTNGRPSSTRSGR